MYKIMRWRYLAKGDFWCDTHTASQKYQSFQWVKLIGAAISEGNALFALKYSIYFLKLKIFTSRDRGVQFLNCKKYNSENRMIKGKMFTRVALGTLTLVYAPMSVLAPVSAFVLPCVRFYMPVLLKRLYGANIAATP